MAELNLKVTSNPLLKPKDFGRVAVLLGGTSAEREISLLSGNAIFDSLQSSGVNVVKIDPKDGLYQQLETEKVDRAFIALHGRDGEDGVIQGFLRMLNIPFTGSDIASSALAMNKLNSKLIWQRLGFNSAAFQKVAGNVEFNQQMARDVVDELGEVLFVKPIREGSSVGMSKSNSVEQLVAAVKLAQQYDDVLIEQFIQGQEYTVSLLAGQAMPSISMVTPNEYYDYDAKYCSKSTEYFCPSGLSDIQEKEIQQQALGAFDALGCSGWGRVDFIQDTDTGRFILLEANTVPGMTKSSLVPKSAAAAGISFEELTLRVLMTSFANNCSHKEAQNG